MNTIDYNPKSSNSLLIQCFSLGATSILDGVFDNDNNEDADVDGVMMMMPFFFPVLLFFKTSGLGQETCVLCL